MSDLIDRQATIDTLDKHLRTTDVPVSYPGIISALTEWLNELPSAQADSKELSGTHKALDTVSRQAVIEAINKIFPADPMRDDYTQGITCGAALANIYVAQLPSAQPEKRTEERTETHTCDCISRQAAMEEISKQQTYKMFEGEDTLYFDANDVGSVIASLPSAHPELEEAYICGETEAEARFHSEIVRCKDCKHFEYDHPYIIQGVPVLGHEVCNAWGNGCKTDENGYCFLAERRTDEE